MKKERSVSIDYLKAFFSICVVLVHLGYISPSKIFNKELYLQHYFIVSDFVNFYILLLAVPIFFITSSYFFSQKPADKLTLFNSVKRIGRLAIFWILFFKIFQNKSWEILLCLPKSVSELISFILSGCNTIYYYFISAIVLTTITHFSKFLNIFHIFIAFIVSIIIVSFLPILAIATDRFILAVYWNPLNFIPYPFAAILVFHLAREMKVILKPAYGILFGFILVGSVVADWTIYINEGFFSVNRYGIPAYTRPSLVFISMAVLFFAGKINFKKNVVIQFLSNNSLALYCLHPFFIPIANRFSGGYLLISLIFTLSLCYLTAILFRHFIQLDLIDLRINKKN